MYKKIKMPILKMQGGNIIIDVPKTVKERIVENTNEKIFTNEKIPMPVLKNIEELKISKDDKKCSPIAIFKNGSCIPTPILIDLTNAYNKYNKNDKIQTYDKVDVSKIDLYKKYLISELQKRLECDQKDWVNLEFTEYMNKEFRDILENHIFRPEGPKKQYEWMSSLDINAVMRQYEEYYKSFKYLGSVPIDFDEIKYYGINNLNFDDLIKMGKTKFGMVINNQKHNQGGQHWFCLYFDLEKGDIFFVDSVGTKPMEQINNYVQKLKDYLISKGIKPNYRINKVVHQKKNSECGVYSMYFILRFLKTGDFDLVTSKPVRDEIMNEEVRDILFTNLEWLDKKNKLV